MLKTAFLFVTLSVFGLAQTNGTFTGASSTWTDFYSEGPAVYLGSGTHSPAIAGYTYGNANKLVLVSWKATTP